METPATPDSNDARRRDPDPTEQGPDADDNSVLHADQLTADDDASGKRPTPPAAKWLLAVVALIVIVVGGIVLFQTFGGRSAEDAVRQAPDVASTSVQASAGTATVEVSRSEDAAVVTFKNLAAPGRTEVYQLWMIPADGSAPISAGMLSKENIAGSKPVVLEKIAGSKEAAVTLEPPGGSQSPTPPFALTIPLTN
ncbi:anti-sigma factor [Arthrobacter sp. I2-34]|uniref:Anti-sigma factor n=1 Tax=Arthrobacter hankyongi TaxID=2904801 RepID=A0ABS9L8E5_9MICC|nr:anti-sigma factor [Arthrobacter hankyongi]MCG2622754.1 anti-sigma factor [Arthrobacter hankyongi]